MTISKGEAWGRTVPRPTGLRVAHDDAHLAELLRDGTSAPTAVAIGDMARTIGARPIDERSELLALPIDLLHFRLDNGPEHTAVAHLIARSPTIRGGLWRGTLLAVMNAEWIGPFDVAPRGHPNDGRVETLLADPSLTVRQRIAVRTRLRNATHLPHPSIATRSVRSHEWDFERPMDVVVDGRRVGRATRIEVRVEPDAALLHA